jgi:uncharacterized protein (TIGR02466 family)
MSAPEISPLFATPFVQTQFPNSVELNQRLRELILTLEANGQYANPAPSMNIPQGLFESQFDFFSQTAPEVKLLKSFCFSALMSTVITLNRLSESESRSLKLRSHTWFHVTRSGAYFATHNHPMASWSGVYCVDPGDTTEGENGALSFINPAAVANMFVDRGNYRMIPPFSVRNFLIRPRAGELLLFPSYLLHQVMPYQGARERLTIAFNCWFE